MSRWCLINYRCDADALSTSTVTERKDIRAQTGASLIGLYMVQLLHCATPSCPSVHCQHEYKEGFSALYSIRNVINYQFVFHCVEKWPCGIRASEKFSWSMHETTVCTKLRALVHVKLTITCTARLLCALTCICKWYFEL